MEKFNYVPNSTSYVAQDNSTVIGTQLEGGLSRYRQDQINASHLVQCQWVLESKQDFMLWRYFYRGVAREGAVRFLMDLVIDDGELEEYTCNFIPGTYALNGVSGSVHFVTSQLEVKPNIVDLDYYASIWVLDNEYGSLEAGLEVINQLNQFVNIDLPNTVGNID